MKTPARLIAQWTDQQIIVAFPWDRAAKYLLRERYAIYGRHSRGALKAWTSQRCSLIPEDRGKMRLRKA